MRSRLLVACASAVVGSVALLGACSSSSSSGGGGGATPRTTSAPTRGRLDDTLRLDQVQVLGSHNSYHGRPYPRVLDALRRINPATALGLDYEHAPLARQFELGVRQIELDVYADPQGGKFARPALPLSVGVDVPDDPVMHQPGFKVLHEANIDTHSTCLTFVRCLRIVRTWSNAHPGHVPIMIEVEMKDTTVDGPTFDTLDSEIRSVFSPAELVTPDLVRGTHPTLGDAVRTEGWPVLAKVRGRIMLTLDNESLRDAYLVGHPSLRGRVLFTPSRPGEDDAAFAKLNDPIADHAAIDAALAAHMMVRTRADADTVQARTDDTHTRDAALGSGAQFVSTDYEQPDPTIGTGYVVRIPGGTPARCDPVTAPPGCRPTDVENPALLSRRR